MAKSSAEAHPRYVDWLAWQQARLSDRLGDHASEWPPSSWLREAMTHDLRWQDPVTGTRFCLARSEAEAITEAAVAWLDRCSDDQLQQFVANPEACARRTRTALPEQVRLVAELPACAADVAGALDILPRPARLVDRASLHVGLLWATCGARLKARWREVRRQVILETFRLHASGRRGTGASGPEAAVALAAAVASGQPLSAQEHEDLVLAGRQLTVGAVKAHTIRVKQYLLQNNKIPAIRGGSILLDSINEERYRRYFATDAELVPEGLLYTGGAGALAVVPPHKAVEAARVWEQLHEDVTLVARSVAVTWQGTLAELVLRFPAVNAVLEARLRARRGAKVPNGAAPDLAAARVDLYDPRTRAPDWQAWEPVREETVCRHCGLHLAVVHLPGVERDEVCAACAIKWAVGAGHTGGARGARGRFLELYRAWGGLPDAEPREASRTLVDLASRYGDGRRVAVVYGDANNMGQVLQEIVTPGQLRQFSQRVDEAIQRAVFPALSQHLGTADVEFIALGGDDLLFVVPADAVLCLAGAMIRRFEHLLWNLSADRPSLTLAVGCAVGTADTPIAYLFEVARQRLASAKREARRRAEAGRPCGTLDIAVVGRASAVGALAKGAEVPGARRLLATLRPFDWRAAQVFASFVRRLQGEEWLSRSSLYALGQAVAHVLQGEASPEEAELYLRYQLARRHSPGDGTRRLLEAAEELRAVCAASGERPAGPPSWVFWPTAEGAVTPWLDVLELWNCAAERSVPRR